jgi:putative membrane protein
MIETAASRTRAPEQGTDAEKVTLGHGKLPEHLSNERTHLAYVRTAISLVTLGITVNRFSLYLKQHDELPAHPGRVDLLGGTATAGLGMVIYALVLMLVALHRYRAVERAIDQGAYRSDSAIIMLLTISVVVASAGGILWMFRR